MLTFFANKYLSYLVFMSYLFFVHHTTILALLGLLLILGLKLNIFGFWLNINKNLVGGYEKFYFIFYFFYHIFYRLLLLFPIILCVVFFIEVLHGDLFILLFKVK